MSSLSRSDVQTYNRLVKETDKSHGGLYTYYGSLSPDGRTAFNAMASIICDRTQPELDLISRSTKDHKHIVKLVSAVSQGGAMTAQQTEEAKMWAINMAAQRMTDKGYVSTVNSTLPADFEADFVEG